MLRLLAQNRRLFLDMRDVFKNKALLMTIKDEKEQKDYLWSLLELYADYPNGVKTDVDTAKQTLVHLSELFGLKQSFRSGWFTHLTGEDGALAMLSLCDENEQWFNFMICDEYMMVEKYRPTTKHIIGLYGRAETGKTPTARKVFHILKNRYPEHAIILNDENNYEVRGVFFVGDAMVSVDSQGDPTGLQMENLDNFVSAGCNVSFLCSRNHGRTVNAIEKFKNTHIIKWVERDRRSTIEEQEKANIQQANQIVDLIEQYASIV